MIAGTIALEGLCVQFSVIGDRVEYTVQDGMTGVTAHKSVTPGEWAATIALMIGGDSPELAGVERQLYDIAEAAQPDAASVLMDAAAANAAANAAARGAGTILIARNVRMIP